MFPYELLTDPYLTEALQTRATIDHYNHAI